MANIFEKYAADREVEQKKIEQTITVSDKKALKMMALEQEMTIAAIIHGWIAEHREEVDK